MNVERKSLAELFERLFEMGAESADLHGCGNVRCKECDAVEASSYEVLRVLSEMMNLDTPGITMSDVLTAAKKAGVY